jgi:hypothetical protein
MQWQSGTSGVVWGFMFWGCRFGVEGFSVLRQNNDGDGLHSPAVAVGVTSGVPAVGVGRGGGRTRC